MTVPADRVVLASVHQLARVYMVLKGAAYIFLGVTWVLYPSPARSAGIAWMDFVTPSMVAGVWITAGAVAVLGAAAHHPWIVRAGWLTLIVAPFILGAYFLVAWIIYLTPGVAGGSERGIVTTVSYLAFTVSAYVMSRVHSLSVHPIEEG